jgi:threonyl-tRNA synthetase
VPVKEIHESGAEVIASKFKNDFIRTEIISNGDSLGKRIHAAKKLNTPYVIVLGDKEIASGNLTIEKRDGAKVEMSADQFQKEILLEIKDRK